MIVKQSIANLDKKLTNTRDKTQHVVLRYKNRTHLEFEIELSQPEKISMIRIWNYNASRMDVSKGIKLLWITSANELIFLGKIKQASGRLENPLKNCESILFTNDGDILQALAKNDDLYGNV